MTDISQWTTVQPLINNFPAWIGDEQEKLRLGAYDLYEQIYLNIGDALKIQNWGTNEHPIYVPAGKQIIDTLARFTALNPMVLPNPDFGTEEQQKAASLFIQDFFRRERFFSKFRANKREGMYRGDSLWHLFADPELPEGARISIFPLDPASYFPIYHPDNVDIVIGCHIAEPFVDLDGKPRIKKLTYRKVTEQAGPSPITAEEYIYDLDSSGLPGIEEGSPVKVVMELHTLPEPIDHIPVYHVKNIEQTGTIWGRSELQGFERLLAALNQGISDEEVALALEGLGVYVTDSGHPTNEDGDEVPWNLGPGRVVETEPNSKMVRLEGITTVQPMQDHLQYLHDQINGTSGTPNIAIGTVDVQIAESGIALLLQMGPILARGQEKEGLMMDSADPMFFDFRKWVQAYEGGEYVSLMEDIRFTLAFKDPLPVNRAAKFQEIQGLYGAGIVPLPWVWRELEKLGYRFDSDEAMVAALQKEAIRKAEAAAAGIPQQEGSKPVGGADKGELGSQGKFDPLANPAPGNFPKDPEKRDPHNKR